MSCTNQHHRNRFGGKRHGGFREYDSLLDHFFRSEQGAAWVAPISIWEVENAFHIEVDAPGVTQENVEVTFDKGTLSITLDRKAPETERTNWHCERGFGKVSRSVSLPETVEPETITAELVNGVLHVSITKRPEAQPKKIDVRVS